jgi:ferric-dicitrate binding protein FerR (iron transport regulator)
MVVTDHIAELIRLAGRRPMPDPARMSTARSAARAEWSRVVKRRLWRKSLMAMAAAVVIVVSGVAVWSGLRRMPAPAVAHDIGSVQTLTGELIVTSSDRGTRRVATAGMRLHSGDRLETPAGSRVALIVGDGLSVRLDAGSAAAFGSAESVSLTQGAIYVDSGVASGKAVLRVDTPFGEVRHVGTQFEVRLLKRILAVSVREGRVEVERRGGRWAALGGERLLLTDHGAERSEVTPFGPDWSWVTTVPQPFQLEGAAVPSFLDWASRELGVRWEYETPGVRTRVETIVLHGSVDGLQPDEALSAVLPTCGLAYLRHADRLVIRHAP